jgi:hypothetical protein
MRRDDEVDRPSGSDMTDLLRAEPMLRQAAAAGCLDEEALAAFASGSGVERRAEFVAHLAACARCRHAVVSLAGALGDPKVAAEVSRLVSPRLGRRVAWVAAGMAAAALLLFVLLPSRDRTSTGGPSLRGGEGTGTVAVVAPVEGEAVRAESVAFVWHRFASGVQYRLTVTDEKGDVAWSAPSSDTTLVPGAATHLQPGRTYFWYVDALLPDGRSATSGVRRLRTAP